MFRFFYIICECLLCCWPSCSASIYNPTRFDVTPSVGLILIFLMAQLFQLIFDFPAPRLRWTKCKSRSTSKGLWLAPEGSYVAIASYVLQNIWLYIFWTSNELRCLCTLNLCCLCARTYVTSIFRLSAEFARSKAYLNDTFLIIAHKK